MISRLIAHVNNGAAFFRLSQRYLHSTRALCMDLKKVTEVRIPVPWGHVAGKWWGYTNKQPILALHGWQDNAGSFDPLLQLLPDSSPILALDLPGHGFSSHYHDGMVYNFANYVSLIRRLQNHYNWNKKLTILGHSGGGVIGFLFSSIYSEFVNVLITLDAAKPFNVRDSYIKKMGGKIDGALSKLSRQSSKNPHYFLDEIENRWLESTGGSLTSEAVKCLSKRGVQLNKDLGKYYLTRDQRLKIQKPYTLDDNQVLEMANSLKCHFLAVSFSSSQFVKESLTYSEDFVNTVSKSCKSFQLVSLEGAHHAHLTKAEIVAPVISRYLQLKTCE